MMEDEMDVNWTKEKVDGLQVVAFNQCCQCFED